MEITYLPGGPLWTGRSSGAARTAALRALGTMALERYYDVRGNYAGSTFATIAPNDPYDIAGADLHAVSMRCR